MPMRIVSILIATVALASCGGGGGGPVAQCPGGTVNCGGVCINVFASDPANCGGCGVVCGGGTSCQGGTCVAPNPFPHLGQPGGPVPTGAPIYRIAPGVGTVVQVGQQAGYGITANVGSSFRIVWTGDAQTSGMYREFWGSIYTGGQFASVTPGCSDGSCALQPDDQVTNPTPAPGGGERIDFDSVAADTLNGFDFTVNGEPVFFDMFIDGQRFPNLVFFPATDNGGQVSQVGAIPFGLTTQ